MHGASTAVSSALTSTIDATDDCSAIQTCANAAASGLDNAFDVYFVITSNNYKCVRYGPTASDTDAGFGTVSDCNVGPDYGYYVSQPTDGSSSS